MLDTAIVGAGPYGLSLAAHLRQTGIPFRIFGRPMDSWVAHMPKGMLLKSDGFASNISDPKGEFTLAQFCAERGIEYEDSGYPVQLDTFSSYGIEFQHRMVPELEQKFVVSVDRSPDGFLVVLEDGEMIQARRVVLAVGVTHFENIPEPLAHLPKEYLTHSAAHRELEPFRGRGVVVIGGGASALDLAGLLREAGTDVKLVCRQPVLKFHSKSNKRPDLLAENQGSEVWTGTGMAFAILFQRTVAISSSPGEYAARSGSPGLGSVGRSGDPRQGCWQGNNASWLFGNRRRGREWEGVLASAVGRRDDARDSGGSRCSCYWIQS